MKKNNTRTIKYLVGIGIYIAVIVLIVIIGLVPKLGQLTKDQNDLNKAKQELVDTTDKRATLEQLSKDKTRIDLVNQTTLEYLPQNPNTSDFVVKVEAMASKLNVIIGTFSFTQVKETTKKTTTDETTSSTKSSSSSDSQEATDSASKTSQKAAPQNSAEFTMVINADYSQIQQFLINLENFPRVNAVDTISVSGYNKEKNTQTLKITGRIFYGN